jgi:N-acyl-D-amino-acid deacylase
VADVAIRGGRISRVGVVREAGAREVDVRGLAVSPGFIDIHSHADLNLLIEPRGESRIRQGITLEVVGQDGSSINWSREEASLRRETFRRSHGVEVDFRDAWGFLDFLDRHPVAVNVCSMVGHGTVRGAVLGYGDRPATEVEIARMRAMVRSAVESGAVGLSSGLEYTPGSFAPPSELVALAREIQPWGLVYASHMRNEDDGLLHAVRETLEVGRQAGVPVQVSHLKAQGRRNYWKAEVALALIEHARGEGVDAHFDRYPYEAYATGLSSLFPPWARQGGTRRLLERLEGPEGDTVREAALAKVALLGGWDAVQISSTGGAMGWAVGGRLGSLAGARDLDPLDLTVELLRSNDGSVGMIGFGMDPANTARFLAHPLGMVCSDGGAFAPYGPLSRSSPHPRAYGSFPRFLGHYVRDMGILSLEEAIRRITSAPAQKLGLEDRGVLRVGAAADITVFSPERVRDRATFQSPHQYPEGILHVVVNGALTLLDGESTGNLAGRSVRGRGYRAA